MLIGNLSELFSSIQKDMTILRWLETYQSYSVLFQNTCQSYVHRKLIKAIQFYSKVYDNLALIRNLSKLFRSIPKHMTILCWSETNQNYSVLFQNTWESDVDQKLIKAIQFYSKAYDSLKLIRKIIKAIQFNFKKSENLTLIGNLSKLFSSIPKYMRILH